MKVAVVGGVFDRDQSYIDAISTPETVLATALRDRHHEVITLGHKQSYRPDDFDVVHVHHLGYGALRATAPRRGRAAVVYTRHRSPGACPAGWKGRMAENLVLRRIDACVALFAGEASSLTRRVRSVVSIPNGIDDALFPYAPRSVPADLRSWRFLYVGQLIDAKRVDIALSVLADWPHAELLIASHNSPHRARVEDLAKELGVHERLRFLGRVAYRQLGEVYEQAHVLLLPSDDEALPSVVTEAMLSGLPVAATDVGGIAEQLDGAYPVTPAGDRGAYVTTVRTLLTDYPATVRRAKLLAERARRTYSVAQMGLRHEQLYESILDDRRRRGRSNTAASPESFLAAQ